MRKWLEVLGLLCFLPVQLCHQISNEQYLCDTSHSPYPDNSLKQKEMFSAWHNGVIQSWHNILTIIFTHKLKPTNTLQITQQCFRWYGLLKWGTFILLSWLQSNRFKNEKLENLYSLGFFWCRVACLPSWLNPFISVSKYRDTTTMYNKAAKSISHEVGYR